MTGLQYVEVWKLMEKEISDVNKDLRHKAKDTADKTKAKASTK